MTLVDPNHTKNNLIANILANNSVLNESNSDTIFSFRSLSDIENARRNLPIWSISPGPTACQFFMAPVPPACANCHVIIGTNRVVPDICPFSFFQIN